MSWKEAIAGGALGTVFNLASRGQDARYQREMAEFNQGLAQEQAKFMQQLNLDTWNKTNYGAQMEHLKKAGLNPALMYKQGGSGGTLGSGSSPNMGAGNPNPNIMGLGLQAAQVASQINVNEAQANKLNADADKTRGADTDLAKANIDNVKVQTQLNSLALDIGNATKDDQIDRVTYEVENLIKRNNLTDEQANLAKEQVLTQGVQRQLMQSNIRVNEGTVEKMVQDIQQGWQRIENDLSGLIIRRDELGESMRKGQTMLNKMKNDFILGVMSKEIDLQRLNIEQQKVFVSMFNSILGGVSNNAGSTTTTTTSGQKGGQYYESKSTTKRN